MKISFWLLVLACIALSIFSVGLIFGVVTIPGKVPMWVVGIALVVCFAFATSRRW